MFKKIFLLSFLILTAASIKAQFIIKATPFVLLKNQLLNVSGEFTLPSVPKLSFTIGCANNFTIKENLQNIHPDLLLDPSKSNSGYSIEPSIRGYLLPTKNQFEGLYAGIYASFRFGYSFYNENITINNVQYHTQGTIQQNTLVSVVGLEVGYQFLLGKKKKIVLDIFAGLGGKNTSIQRESKNIIYYPVSSTTKQGIATRGNFSIGYLIK